MTINERVRLIRNTLNLTQKEFGQKLTLAQTYLSQIEKGDREVTEKIFKIICFEFNVNENWLRTGEGEMFESIPKDELDKLAARYKLNPLAKRIVECFVSLEESEMNAVLKLVKDIASVTHDEIAVAKEDEVISKKDELAIERELQSYRLELEAEKKGITSSAYEDTRKISSK